MGSEFGGFPDEESLNYANFFNYKSPSEDLTSLSLPSPTPSMGDPFAYNPTSSSNPSPGVDSNEDSDSDDVLKYISQMLMEEDMDEKPCMFHDPLALHAAEKPFYDALGKKYPTSPDQHPFIDHYLDSPDDDSLGSIGDFGGNFPRTVSSNSGQPTSVSDSIESSYNPPLAQTPSIESHPQPLTHQPQWSFGNLGAFDSGFSMGLMNMISEEESMIQFQKGVEEASKFLPKTSNLVIDLENITFPSESKKDGPVRVVKKEKDESPDYNSLRGSKIHYREDYDYEEEERSSKQSAVVSSEEAELSDMFDRVLLCHHMKPPPHEDETEGSKGPGGGGTKGRGRPKKQDSNGTTNVVDLSNLLIQCAQSTASDDRRTSDQLLKRIREHSSPEGDGSQRVAHYFANALEARLAGTGSHIYTALSSNKPSAADMIKAYQFYVRACPFKKISIGFANHTILKAAEKASKLHIIDFGILYGFQWPTLIQRLVERPGGPPKLVITGIDLPQPGFRPAERVEATGRRLARYCERYRVPFEYHAVAQKWETIKPQDLKLATKRENDEVVAVNCMYRFKNLLDETIVVDSPRNAVLNLIRRVIRPDIFVHGVINGSYNIPFFVTRFREALFHYSTLFDMLEANTSREEPERLMFEKAFYGREIMNVVACEATERVERPETYKQWQARLGRAGFRQVPLDPELEEKVRTRVKGNYHKDFMLEINGHWIVQGWKGRIIHAMSAWAPA